MVERTMKSIQTSFPLKKTNCSFVLWPDMHPSPPTNGVFSSGHEATKVLGRIRVWYDAPWRPAAFIEMQNLKYKASRRHSSAPPHPPSMLIAGGTRQAKLETGDASVFPWGPTKPPQANNVSWGRLLRTYVRVSVAVDNLQLRGEVDMAGTLLGMALYTV